MGKRAHTHSESLCMYLGTSVFVEKAVDLSVRTLVPLSLNFEEKAVSLSVGTLVPLCL